MPHDSDPNKWQNPVKNWGVAGLIHGIRDKIVAWQKAEYKHSNEISDYFANMQTNGLPFVNYAGEPDQIQQMKDFLNALYEAEKLFEKMETFDLQQLQQTQTQHPLHLLFMGAEFVVRSLVGTSKSVDTQNHQPVTLASEALSLIRQAYETTHKLLKISADLEGTFQSEITTLLSYLSSANEYLSTYSKNSESDDQAKQAQKLSSDMGVVIGRAISQMKLKKQGKPGDYDISTYFGAVFPAFPIYIETARIHVERITAKNPEHLRHVNKEKMQALLMQGEKLSETIKNSNQNIISLIFNLLSLIGQINSLWSELYKEAGQLNEITEDLAREWLTLLKKLLASLLAGVDKLETHMMREPGISSVPLMEQIKPWYEALTQTTKYVVAFDKKGENLLKLEDADFIALRLSPAHQRIEQSTQALHQINLTITALDEAEALLNNDSYPQAIALLKKYMKYLSPHLTPADDYFNRQLDNNSAKPNWISTMNDWWWQTHNSPTTPNVAHLITELRQRLNQLKTDHEFKIKRNEALIESVQAKANMVLFPYRKPGNILALSDRDAFAHRYSLSSDLIFVEDNATLHLQNPEKLAADEAWDLYRWYDHQLSDIERAEKDCTQLLTHLESHYKHKQVKNRLLAFHPEYTLLLLAKDKLPQPGININIENDALKYTVLEPATGGCKLYLKSLDEAIKAGHTGCYVWDQDKSQLSYIADDGHVLENIKLNNTGLFTTTIHFKILTAIKRQMLSKIKEENVIRTNNNMPLLSKKEIRVMHETISARKFDFLNLNAQNIESLITSNGGHHPGIIRTGSIPLSELNCTLTLLTSVKQIKPWLPRLLDEALERGHIHDPFRMKCIQLYSTIQPYLIGAFAGDRIKNIHEFDRRVVHLFSGHFYKETSRESLSYAEFNIKIPGLLDILSAKKQTLMKKRNDLFKRIEKQAFTVEPAPSPSIKHKEFAPDIVEFTHATASIKRQIHESKKTLFNVNLALIRLQAHCQEAGAEQLRTRLKQIQFYETEQIKRNEAIIKAALPSNQPVEPYDTSETCAFMHFSPIHEAGLMADSKPPQKEQLLIKVEDGQLHYLLIHYGKQQTGQIALNVLPSDLKETLMQFDQNAILSNDTLSSILKLIYTARQKQIIEDETALSPEEALELHQWYLTRLSELEQAEDTFISWKNHINNYIDIKKKNARPNIGKKAEPLHRLLHPYLRSAWKEESDKTRHIETFEKACSFIQSNPNTFDVFTLFFETEKQQIKRKIASYEIQAKQQPAFEKDLHIESQSDRLNDRTDYLLKHTRCSASLIELQTSIDNLYNQLNSAFKEKLKPALQGLPFPEAGAQNWLTAPLIAAGAMGNFDIVELVKQYYVLTQTSDRTINPHIPHQILPFMRLKNLAYYLEQIVLQMEKVNVRDQQIPHVLNILASYLYIQDIQPLIEALRTDPHLTAMYRDIVSKANAFCSALRNESKYYVGEGDPYANKNHGLLSIISILNMFPKRISAHSGELEEQYLALKNKSEQDAAKIEKIIKNINSSYLLLFLDSLMMASLVRELRLDVARLLQETHDTVLRDLDKINTTYITKIVSEADAWEARLGLDPGILSTPVNDVFAVFYQGLVTSLVPDVDEQVRLLCNVDLIEHRQEMAQRRSETASIDDARQRVSSRAMQALLDACDTTQPGALDALNAIYKQALPHLKQALTGSKLHVMSIQEAKANELTDCFIWNDDTNQLYHLDPAGKTNAQTGCSLQLKSIPAEASLPADLEYEISLPFPFHHNRCGFTWMPEEPNEEDLTNFTRSQYIRTNTGLFYYDKNMGSLQKIELNADKLKRFDCYFKANEPVELLSPAQLREINFLTDHVLQKATVLLMVKKPTLIQHGDKYYIYVNADGKDWTYTPLDPILISNMKLDFTHTTHLDIDAKYQDLYADIASKTGLIYPIHLKNNHKFIKFITDKRKSQVSRLNDLYLSETELSQFITSNSDFILHNNNVHLLNDEQCMADVDAFVATETNVTTLQRVVTRCKAHYDTLSATSTLDIRTADIQLTFLSEERQRQVALNPAKRSTLYKEHLYDKVNELCKENIELQGYTLCLLPIVGRPKPNTLYCKIKGSELVYTVISPAGKTCEGTLNLCNINCPRTQLVSADDLLPWLPKILETIYKEQHGNTRPHSLATEYQEKLKIALVDNSDTIITQALASTQSIDKALDAKKTAFDEEHLASFQKLDAINKAVDQFENYLKAAKLQWSTKQSLFENEETLRRKTEVLSSIAMMAADQGISVAERTIKIRNHLKRPDMLEALLNYNEDNATWYARLLQCTLQLFEAVGLYTPAVAQSVDTLLNAIGAPAATVNQPKPFRFFAETTRERIKAQIEALRQEDESPLTRPPSP